MLKPPNYPIENSTVICPNLMTVNPAITVAVPITPPLTANSKTRNATLVERKATLLHYEVEAPAKRCNN